jgi:hypothetical protein
MNILLILLHLEIGFLIFQPAVSVGNIGQLSVDLLISSLNCDKLAKLDHPVFVPVVGSDPYDEIREQGLMTAAECNLIDIKCLTECI